MATISSRLPSWSDVADEFEWTAGLLLGNGASCAVWDQFKYRSLYEIAKSEEIRQPLNAVDVEFFRAMTTTNFEEVLSALAVARRVGLILGESVDAIDERYESIRISLVEAVHAVHVPWRILPNATLDSMRRALRKYGVVYSTNYDLLVYWAMMSNEGQGFRDYFWSEQFDATNAEIWDARWTRVLFLHGALHLYRLPSGQTLKRSAGDSGLNLLDQFGTRFRRGAVPLFVSEGSSEHKLRAIFRSDYLSFAYGQLQQHEGPLVVFGHSLSENDAHILNALDELGRETIAIGMMPARADRVIERKAALRQRLSEAKLLFFDASTHPLGDPALKLEVEEDD